MRVVKELTSPLNRLFIYETEDGHRVESVFYKGERLCVSSQVGCPVGCAFCASGLKGLKRNLSAEELKAQYLLLKGKLPIKGIAIAGIGEPALNSKAVVEAIEFFRREGLKVTVSTTGCVSEGFKELIEAPHNGLTVSVHGVKRELREQLFKLHRPIEEILNELEEHLSGSSSGRRKKFQLGYLLLKGVNDDEENLRLLAELALKHRFTVMLMAFNEVKGLPFKGLTEKEYEKAFLYLRSLGVRVTLSNRFRRDPLGGCGTLTIAREV